MHMCCAFLCLIVVGNQVILFITFRIASMAPLQFCNCPQCQWNISEQVKSEGFDSCDRPYNLTQIGFKSSTFQPVWPWNLMDDLEKQWGTSSILCQALCIVSKPSVDSNWSYSPETLRSGQNRRFFVSCDVEIFWMTLKTNRAPLLCYFNLCASFHSHW